MLLTGILFYIYYKQKLRKSKEKEQKTKLELQSIQAQLNPHFVFNALNSIQYLVNSDEKSAANKYLIELSQLMRNALYNNEKELAPLSIELQTLESYIKLEQLRFHFSYSMEVDRLIEQDSISIPTLLLQPIIENAIKHGFGIVQEKGILVLSIFARDKDMIVSIADNGKGFDTSQPSLGFGLRLIRQRIDILNKMYTIHIDINTSKNGTLVKIIFSDWL